MKDEDFCHKGRYKKKTINLRVVYIYSTGSVIRTPSYKNVSVIGTIFFLHHLLARKGDILK